MNSDNYCYKGGSCPKAGIKIHETPHSEPQLPPHHSMPIKNEKNNLNFNGILDELDLNIDNYSLKELLELFNVPINEINKDNLKQAKQITLKMHPDKSGLDSKYFLFFSKAYKKLYGIYEFQNKSSKNDKNTEYVKDEFYDDGKSTIINDHINASIKQKKNFNEWFNKEFEKYRLNDMCGDGYGEWLKGDEGIMDIQEKVTQSNMNDIFEAKKKQMQSVIKYNGISDSHSYSSCGGFSFGDTSSYTTGSYTDLRQAYTETLIPVTNEDYLKMQKFNNYEEYRTHRNNVDVSPISAEESENILYRKRNEDEIQSAAMAYKLAQETQKAKENDKSFWANLKTIRGTEQKK